MENEAQIRFNGAYAAIALRLTRAMDDIANQAGELAIAYARIKELESEVEKLRPKDLKEG